MKKEKYAERHDDAYNRKLNLIITDTTASWEISNGIGTKHLELSALKAKPAPKYVMIDLHEHGSKTARRAMIDLDEYQARAVGKYLSECYPQTEIEHAAGVREQAIKAKPRRNSM